MEEMGEWRKWVVEVMGDGGVGSVKMGEWKRIVVVEMGGGGGNGSAEMGDGENGVLETSDGGNTMQHVKI